MGRAYEFRKARKMKRWGNMARTFTRLGKEIVIAVKAGGPDPDSNARLRMLIQTSRSENMPKDNVDRAIKRAVSKDMDADYKEIQYDGYGPFGIAILVETATNNNTRTVANVRSYFSKSGGSLGTTGCLDFLFDHKSVFKIKPAQEVDIEEFEFELIDYGADEVFADENGEILIYGAYEAFSKIQHYLEEQGYEILRGEFERIPNDQKEVTAEQRIAIDKLLDKFDDDEDVQRVYHNMKHEDDTEEA